MLAHDGETGTHAAAIFILPMQTAENREDGLLMPLGNADAIVPDEEYENP